MKSTPLLALLPTVTTTFPDAAPVGTFVVIDDALQPTIGAVVPLNVTVPAVEPKLVPTIVTNALTTPMEG